MGRSRPDRRRAQRQPRRGSTRTCYIQDQVVEVRDRGRHYDPTHRRYDQTGPRTERRAELRGRLQRWRT